MSSPTPVEQARVFRVVKFDRAAPDLREIHRALGLRAERAEHRRWIEFAEEFSATATRLVRPRAIYRIDAVHKLEPRRLELVSRAAYDGAIGQFLDHSRLIATFIVTIGSALERLSRRWLRDGQVMGGTIADALASEYAEATAARCQREVRAWAHAEGLEISPRYSPGYCGMDISQQAALFASLPAERINVRLTSSRLMLPIKSVSGLIGIGSADEVSPAEYPCTRCDHPTCPQRRTPFKPGR